MRPEYTIDHYMREGDFIDVDESFIYLYGPYMVMHRGNYEGMISDLCKRFPIMVLFDQASKLANTLETDNSYKDLKSKILEMNRKYLSTGAKEATIFTDACNICIENIRKHQRDNMLLESAMTNFAPIQPYGSVIYKTTDGVGAEIPPASMHLSPSENGSNLYENASEFCRSLDNHLDHGNINDVINDLLKQYLLPILLNTGLTPVINTHGDKPWEFVEGLHRLLMKTEAPRVYENYQFYYLVCALKFAGYLPDKRYHQLLRPYMKPEKRSFESLMTAFTLPENTDLSLYEENLFSMEAWEVLSEEAQANIDKILAKVEEDNPIQTNAYDLDRFMAYIHTHRHINCNEYANMLFLSETRGIKIEQFNTFADNVLICEINGEYLVCPFTDLADDYRIKLLCMNKQSEIFIKDHFRFDSDVPRDELTHEEETELE